MEFLVRCSKDEMHEGYEEAIYLRIVRRLVKYLCRPEPGSAFPAFDVV